VEPFRDGPRANYFKETPRPPWQLWRVTRDRAIAATAPVGGIDAYVVRASEKRAPLVVFVQGSAYLPLFRVRKERGRRRTVSTVPGGIEEYIRSRKRALNFAFVERTGFKSFEVISRTDENRARGTKPPSDVSKETRVRDVAAVARAFSAEPWVSDLILVGHSEGADVASAVVRDIGADQIRALGLLAGGGPTQFFDFVIEARRTGAATKVQQVFDELLQLDDPNSRPTEYRGHPVERILSYAVETSILAELSAVQIPVFIAQGTEDTHVPVESSDLLALELLRMRPLRPVRYVIGSDLDHGFVGVDGRDHSAAIFDDFLSWAVSSNKQRSVSTFKTVRRKKITTRYFGVPVDTWVRIACAGLPLAGIVAASRHSRTDTQSH